MARPSQTEMKTKTPEERKWINDYFYFQGGCLKKPIPEAEYVAAVKARAKSLNLYKAALNKIGLDESEVQEIKPVVFEGFDLKDNRAHTINRTSSKYTVTWLFFSATQIYFYAHTFDMTSNDKRVVTEEYFYKDVTNLSSSNETIEVNITKSGGCLGKTETNVRGQVDFASFGIIVPGDRQNVPMEPTEENERIIQGMKQKLREKKA